MRPLLCIILLFLSIIICSPYTGYAQKPDSIVAMFTQYQQSAIHEKLFVHTTKANYLVGETLLFKIYNTDASLNRPLALYFSSGGGAVSGYQLSIFASAVPFVNYNLKF